MYSENACKNVNSLSLPLIKPLLALEIFATSYKMIYLLNNKVPLICLTKDFLNHLNNLFE